jgi:AraC family transcriptional regulator, transcriptional activator of pobA
MKPIPIRYIKSEKEVAPNFRIRTVEALLGGSDMVQELHRHNFYFLLALKKGKGTHEIDFAPYKVEDNSFFIMRPGQVHQLTLKAGSTGFLLEFNSEFYQLNERGTSQVLRQATHTNLCRMDTRAFTKLHAVLSYIAEEYQEQQEGYQQIIRSNLDIFFIEFLRQRKQNDRPAAGSAYEQEKLQQFLEQLEKNARTQKQVSEYADAMNMSVYQLNNVTKTTLGKTASDVISDHIILEAKRCLLATSEQVNQIAYHLGYEDPSYFIRFFKKHTQHTPEAFRSNFK